MSFTNQAAGLVGAAAGAYLSPNNRNAGVAVGLAIGFWSVDAAEWLWKNRHDPEVQRLIVKAVSSTTMGLLAYAITGSDIAMTIATGATIHINNVYAPRPLLHVHVAAGAEPPQQQQQPQRQQQRINGL